MMHLRNIWLLLLPAFYSASAQQYNFRQYNVQDGLAHSQVSSILQDSKGYLWFATYGGGLSRFDGKIFRNFTESDGLPDNIIRPMIEASNGDIWLGTMGGGLCRFDGKKFSVLKDSATKINEKIYTVMQSRDGSIWFGADNGLYHYNGRTVRHFTEKDGLPEVPVMSVFEDSKGLIWVAPWENGICSFDGKQFSFYSEKKNNSPFSTEMCFNEDTEGNIWVCGFKGVAQLKRDPSGKIKVLKGGFSDYLDKGLSYMVHDDKKGHLWFATTDKGIIRYDKKSGKYEQISTANGLPGNCIIAISQDREGNIWTSCWGLGVAMFQGDRFVHYTSKDGLGGDIISHVISDGKGGLVINPADGIYRYTPEKGIALYDKKLDHFKASALAMDGNGTLWLGTNSALYSFANGSLKKYTREDGITSFPVTFILCEGQNVWAASWSGGLTKFDGKIFRNFSAEDGLSSPYIYSVTKSRKGDIYIGTWDGGLNVYDGKKFVVYRKEQGLPSNNVISIVESKDHVWVGTFGGGICRFDGKHLLSMKDGLSDNAIVAMVVDKQDNLYIAGSKGLNKLDASQFGFDRDTDHDIRFYGNEEGFRGIECNHNAAICDEDGNLWFGTKKGLTRFDPALDKINNTSTPTYITGVRLFFEKADWSKFTHSVDTISGLPIDPVFDHRNNHITFDFIGINTSGPGKVRYQYILDGADIDFSPLTDKTEVTYSGLSPGEYTFRVKAYNDDGLIPSGQKEASFSFRILPPFWKRTWFYLLCLFLLVAGSMLYTKWRTKKLAKANRVLEEKVDERTSELQTAYREIEHKNILVEQKNRDITDSINYAKRIQYTLLANEETLKKNLPDHFIFFQPKDIVSGDFYWAMKKDDRFYLAVCDSTGHGVPGAFMSLMNISFLNEAISEKNIAEPDRILGHVRHRLINSISKDGAQDGMDGILLCFDRKKNEITYSGGQNRPVLIRDGKVIALETDKMPIGKGESEEPFRLHRIDNSGGTLYLYTDGYADQFGGKSGKKFKYKQLQDLLLDNHTRSMAEQHQIYARTINDWKGKLEQIDDILLVGIRI